MFLEPSRKGRTVYTPSVNRRRVLSVSNVTTDAPTTSLVVLSDMVARSPQLALNRAFIEARIDGTVAELQAQGLVPDLGGVEVYVVGAGVASGDELPGAMIVTIQRFWEALFAAAGSELRPERYGAALVRFP